MGKKAKYEQCICTWSVIGCHLCLKHTHADPQAHMCVYIRTVGKNLT